MLGCAGVPLHLYVVIATFRLTSIKRPRKGMQPDSGSREENHALFLSPPLVLHSTLSLPLPEPRWRCWQSEGVQLYWQSEGLQLYCTSEGPQLGPPRGARPRATTAATRGARARPLIRIALLYGRCTVLYGRCTATIQRPYKLYSH